MQDPRGDPTLSETVSKAVIQETHDDLAVEQQDDPDINLNNRIKRALAKKEARKCPKITLTYGGVKARLFDCKTATPFPPQNVKPVDLFELQAMILACIIPSGKLSVRPTICEVQRSHTASNVGIFVLNQGVPFTVDENELKFLFQDVISFEPSEDLLDRLTLVPLTSSQNRKLMNDRDGSSSVIVKTPGEDTFDDDIPATKTELVMTSEQLKSEGYPEVHDSKFIPSLDEYDSVTDESPLFALDCEMCLTQDMVYEVTRITVIDEREEVVLDSFCLPKKKIIDYKTKYSGVRKEDLDGIQTTIEDVRMMLRKILPRDAILVGQSLDSDLKALGITHPYIIDTSVLFNLSGNRGIKTSLKNLARKFLERDIQTDEINGHCPVEDSKAALNLVQLKMKKGVKFGDVILCPAKKSEWMKGKAHFMPIVSFVRRKEVEDFNVYYDYVFKETDPFPSKSMLIFSDPRIKVKDSVVRFISYSSIHSLKYICIVVTFDGRCYLSAK